MVGKDEATDLALLRIEGGPFPVLPLGDSDAVEVGEWVVAIGNPFGLARSVTTGIVSYKGRRDVNLTGKPGYYDFVQTDAAINPGNSGGPLLDARGAVIAINAAVNPSGQGIGFAVPINMFKELARQLESRGHVVRGWMGLSIQEQLSPELAESFGVPGGRGVLITEVVAGGAAALQVSLNTERPYSAQLHFIYLGFDQYLPGRDVDLLDQFRNLLPFLRRTLN